MFSVLTTGILLIMSTKGLILCVCAFKPKAVFKYFNIPLWLDGRLSQNLVNKNTLKQQMQLRSWGRISLESTPQSSQFLLFTRPCLDRS